MSTFDSQQFISDCRGALRESTPERAMREVVARAVAEPSAILRALGEPTRAEIQRVYHAPEVTILNVVWAPYMILMPHNHRMPAVIGIYSGREDNIFWKRVGDKPFLARGAFHNAFARRCLHCGLPRGAKTDPDWRDPR